MSPEAGPVGPPGGADRLLLAPSSWRQQRTVLRPFGYFPHSFGRVILRSPFAGSCIAQPLQVAQTTPITPSRARSQIPTCVVVRHKDALACTGKDRRRGSEPASLG